MLLRVAFAVLFAALVGCRSCEKPRPAEPVLTEKDAEVIDGGVGGTGWRVVPPSEWLAVKAQVKEKLKPTSQAWLVNPAGPLQLTVECGSETSSALESLRRQVPLKSAVTERVEGAWLDGAKATWEGDDGVHVFGRFLVLTGRCDVHAFGPSGASRAALEQAVMSFRSAHPRVVSELLSLSAFIASHPAIAARDAGTASWSYPAGSELMRYSQQRLPPERLAERFALRLKFLEVLDTKECAGLVRRMLDDSPRWLARVDEADAVRWVGLTREALNLSLSATTPPPLPAPEELTAAVLALGKQDDGLSQALSVLQHADKAREDEVCAAERLRLNRVLALPEPHRAALLRNLLGER